MITSREYQKLSRQLRSAIADLSRSTKAKPLEQSRRFQKMILAADEVIWIAEPILVRMKRKLRLTH